MNILYKHILLYNYKQKDDILYALKQSVYIICIAVWVYE